MTDIFKITLNFTFYSSNPNLKKSSLDLKEKKSKKFFNLFNYNFLKVAIFFKKQEIF